MLIHKCIGVTKKGNPCKKEAVMITGQCVKHWYRDYRKGI